MQSPYLLAFIAVMLAIAVGTLVMLVRRRLRARAPQQSLPEAERSDAPTLIVQAEGEAARPAPEGAAPS
jgi:hypothetical protein